MSLLAYCVLDISQVSKKISPPERILQNLPSEQETRSQVTKMTSKPTEMVHGNDQDQTTLTEITSEEIDDEVAAQSENGSLHSRSDHSDTSTLKYTQESYSSFKTRVERLCQELWPPQKSLRHFLAYSRTATRMRTNKLLRPFVPSQKTAFIERLRGGDFNRIIGITLPKSRSTKNIGRHLILRVPRWGGQINVERVVAMMDYVRLNSNIPTGTILAKDFSDDNPLGSPYLIQNRTSGSDLEVLWPDLNHLQRCAIAREVGSVIKSLLLLESPVGGHIEAKFTSTGTEASLIIVPFDLKDGEENLIEDSEPQKPLVEGGQRQSQSTLDFFKSQIARWRTVDLASNAGMVDHSVELWDSMLKVAEEMSDLGLFTSKGHCLCHVDLQPRNIMANINPDGSIKVTGILDWDDAVFAPKFVNCEPPGWLWGFDPDEVPHPDLPAWPYEIPGADNAPEGLEKQELKRILEEGAGPEYLSMAYEEHHRMSRALFRVAVFGLTAGWYYEAAESIISDWEKLRRALKQ